MSASLPSPVHEAPLPDAEAAPGARWSRTTQLGAVFTAHFLILSFVLVLVEIFKAEPSTPPLFIVAEAAILIVCGWPLVNMERFRQMADNFGIVNFIPRQESRTAAERFAMAERFAGGALLFAFALQLVALWPLIDATNGPIESPFAPMAVAIAAFTPFLANNPRTVLVVGLITGLYYTSLVWVLDNLHTRWDHLAVNLSILGLSVLLTLGDLLKRDVSRNPAPS